MGRGLRTCTVPWWPGSPGCKSGVVLIMKVQCERCRTQLAPDGPAAICSYECTFCPDCAAAVQNVCPNCSGELVIRPRRVGSPVAGQAGAAARSIAGRLAVEARNLTAARLVPDVSVERLVAAPPEAVFAILADPEQHSAIDGSGTLTGSPSGPGRLAVGSRFTMGMTQKGVPYRSTNEVVEFEEGTRIAWQTFAEVAGVKTVGGQIWRYELVPAAGGTMIRHTYDWTQARAARVTIELGGFPERSRQAMERTLDRLAVRAEAGRT